MDDFGCPACDNPGLVYPSVLEDDEPVACASTAMDHSAPSRPGLGQSRSGAPRYATGLTSPRRKKSASPAPRRFHQARAGQAQYCERR
jgi:hypothetical protein